MKGTKKIILLNAPPDCGKDFAVENMRDMWPCAHMEFKAPMFKMAMAITGLSKSQFFKIYNNKALKDKPHELFHGKSPRELMISISEDYCKPNFGVDFFGKVAAQSVANTTQELCVFSDSGFPEEANVLIDQFGAENVCVVRFTRKGKTFAGDSRNFLKEEDLPEGVMFLDLTNDGDIDDFIYEIMDNFLPNFDE